MAEHEIRPQRTRIPGGGGGGGGGGGQANLACCSGTRSGLSRKWAWFISPYFLMKRASRCALSIPEARWTQPLIAIFRNRGLSANRLA